MSHAALASITLIFLFFLFEVNYGLMIEMRPFDGLARIHQNIYNIFG